MRVQITISLVFSAFIAAFPSHAAEAANVLPYLASADAQASAPSAPAPAVSTPAPSAPPTADAQPTVLRGTLVKEPASGPQDNSVESFFQINPNTRNSSQNPLMQPAVVPSSSADKDKTFAHGMYRFFWHVLDNAGVPMFFGHDPYIDPTISGTYVIPSPKLPREKIIVKEMETTGTTATPSTPTSPPGIAQPEPQKIPETELEGVPLPTPRDDVNEQAP